MSGTAPPWWLDPGPLERGGGEVCDFCLQRYAYEAAYWCADCDRPACPGCVVSAGGRRETLCPECGPGVAGAGDRSRRVRGGGRSPGAAAGL